MSNSILIIGESGSGKTSSIRTLDSKETFLIKVTDKSIPFKNANSNYLPFEINETKDKSKGNVFTSHNTNTILNILDHISKYRLDIKNIIIDDLQYQMSFEFMARAKESGFNKFTEIAKNSFDVYMKSFKLRDDIFVFMMSHSETTQDSEGIVKTKIKTLGKLLDDKITLEGLFTIVLQTNIEIGKDKVEYTFITNTNGKNTAKSPMDMFEYKIPNDLQLVKNKIIEYNN